MGACLDEKGESVIPWGIAAAAVVGAYGASQQASAAKKGAAGQAQASAEATAEQRRQYDLTREDQQPFLQAGYGALDRQEAILGGDYSGFMSSPDYLWARDQGLQGVDRSAAARGRLYSGGADADRMSFASGLATQNLNNYWAKLAGQAGQGFNAANSLGAFGANAANQIGNNAMNAANARSSSYAAGANAWGNWGNQLSGMIGSYYGNRNG